MVENQEACFHKNAPLDDAKVDSYIAPCPMGFEHVMIDAIMYSLEKAGFGGGKSEVVWLFSPSEDKLEGMKVQVAKHLQLKEEKRLKKKDIEKSANQKATYAVSEDDHSVIVGPLNDGSNLFLGQYEGNVIVSRPGATEVGIILIRTSAPPSIVSNIRVIGPLLGLVSIHHDIFTEPLELDQISRIIEDLRCDSNTVSGYKSCLNLWSRHASMWKQRYGPLLKTSNDLDNLHDKINGKVGLKYRASCVRNGKCKAKQFKTCDLFASIGSSVPHDKLEGFSLDRQTPRLKSKINPTQCWSVDLKKYDFEVVGFLVDTHFVLAISLIPYQLMNANGFSRTCALPSDVTPPFVTKGNEEYLIRLRPSTSSLLVHLANPQKGDILVDVCAGLGTIPIEAALSNRSVVGLGGEISPYLDGIMSEYASEARRLSSSLSLHGASDICLWDATLLSYRDSCADLIISDLPFGQKCMNSKKLRQFSPLLLAEVARILRVGGRAILLSGIYRYILDYLNGEGKSVIFLRNIFPVNIGGHLAYVVEIERKNGAVYVDRHRDKVRKMTQRRTQEWKRDDASHLHSKEKGGNETHKRQRCLAQSK